MHNHQYILLLFHLICQSRYSNHTKQQWVQTDFFQWLPSPLPIQDIAVPLWSERKYLISIFFKRCHLPIKLDRFSLPMVFANALLECGSFIRVKEQK